MKALILQGSPRKKGFTAQLAEIMTMELDKRGYTTISIYMHSQNIRGCLACGKCKDFPGEAGCVQKDDATGIMNEMTTSDLVVFATPLYFWGFSAQIKLLIDRTYSLYNYRDADNPKTLMAEKKLALLLVGEDNFEDNAECVFSAFDRYHGYQKTINAGKVYFSGNGGQVNYPVVINDKTRQRVIDFTNSL